jgi:hypothetical protein
MPIVAFGITELLHQLLAINGTDAHVPGPYHGDAYAIDRPTPRSALFAADPRTARWHG